VAKVRQAQKSLSGRSVRISVVQMGTVTHSRVNVGVMKAGINQTAPQRSVQTTATEMAVAPSKALALVMKVIVVLIAEPSSARGTVAIRASAILRRRPVNVTMVSRGMIAPKSHA